jgi:hypothetical protein
MYMYLILKTLVKGLKSSLTDNSNYSVALTLYCTGCLGKHHLPFCAEALCCYCYCFCSSATRLANSASAFAWSRSSPSITGAPKQAINSSLVIWPSRESSRIGCSISISLSVSVYPQLAATQRLKALWLIQSWPRVSISSKIYSASNMYLALRVSWSSCMSRCAFRRSSRDSSQAIFCTSCSSKFSGFCYCSLS